MFALRRYLSNRKFLIPVLLLLVLSRIWRLGEPATYYFDEVYHVFTAQAYAKNDPRGYEWWHTAPEGFAYDWLHPPLAKLIQAASIKVLGDTPFAWRLPGALLGIATGILLYLAAKKLFRSERIGFLALFFWTFDGLALTMSRITMNDIYLTFWVVLAFYFFLIKKPLWQVGLILGAAVATKWTGVFAVLFIWLLSRGRPSLILALAVVYLVSYTQFFLQGHTWGQFIELHRQVWWYQTNLEATHPYSSSALSWPILARPVYAFTESFDAKVANIYLMGNPLIFWAGVPFVFYALFRRAALPVLVGYFIMFLPWVFSPRILFIYHYLPALPFLFLILAWGADKVWGKRRLLVISYLSLVILVFVFFYPHWTGIPVPQEIDLLYYWFPSWR